MNQVSASSEQNENSGAELDQEPAIASAGAPAHFSRPGSVPPEGTKPTLKERIGKKYLSLFNARKRVGTPFRKVPEGLHSVANQISLSLELIDDFRSGEYRSIPWGSLAVLTGALLYTVSPADIIPDALLGLGQLDDAMVLALAMRVARPQLQAYCRFKGYKLDAYFGPLPRLQKNSRRAPPVAVEPEDVAA